MSETFNIGNHPSLLVTCGIYHSEKKGIEPTFRELYDVLKPLITQEEMLQQLQELVHWGVVHRNLKPADTPRKHISTYCISGVSAGTSRHIYETYWLGIEMKKLETSEFTTNSEDEKDG